MSYTKDDIVQDEKSIKMRSEIPGAFFVEKSQINGKDKEKQIERLQKSRRKEMGRRSGEV